MTPIVWDDRLKTGHGAMDEQHEALVEILNRLHEAMHQGRGKAELEGILVLFQDYAQTHFAAEEAWMERSQYAGTARHRQIHADLTVQVRELVAKFQLESGGFSLQMMNFLEDWLVRHIESEDLPCAAELRSQSFN
jgi:hemerythrin-like metal-binding protein